MTGLKKRISGVVLAAIVSLVAIYFGTKLNYEKTGKLTADFDYLEKPVFVQIPPIKEPVTPTGQTVTVTQPPSTYLIEKVPYTPQAPHAIWDAIHKDACEEAAALMVARYVAGQRSGLIPADDAEAEIQRLVSWQRDKFGYFEDTNVEQTAQILREFYGLKDVEVRSGVTLADIKQAVGLGKLVIVPAAGRLLGNPFFTQPGPIYHMLVVIGYTQNQMITNDPGTRRGEGFRYKNEIFFNAIHDWVGEDDKIEQGFKAMIVVSP